MEVRWWCDNDVTGNIWGSTCDAQKVRAKSFQSVILYMDLYKEMKNKALLMIWPDSVILWLFTATIFTGCCFELNHNKFLIRRLRLKDGVSVSHNNVWCRATESRKDKKLSWNCSGSIGHLVWQTYCHGCVPIDLRESVPDPINLFVPQQPLLCLGSVSWWEVNVRLNRDRDHTDVPIQSHTHTCVHTRQHIQQMQV